MKIKSIEMKNFKRFTDLTIEGLPETAKLVVMIGPNGCGKSSVFDALHLSRIVNGNLSSVPFDSYYIKADPSQLTPTDFSNIDIRFYPATPKSPDLWRKCVHVRSAYRHDLSNRNISFPHSPSIDEQPRFVRLTQNDPAVAINYGRLLSLWIERSSTLTKRSETLGELQDEVFGDLRDTMARLFRYPELVLESLGNPPTQKSPFRFNKQISRGFSYEHLSSGEKTALDLILDIIVFKAELGDTVFCIDEPELHIHTKLQGQLLEELYNLISDNSQLWIATHSIGMVSKAQDLWRENQDSVVFLDFEKNEVGEDRDFDRQETIKPAEPNPNFWAQTYEVALGDLAELVAPQRIVLCEGKIEEAQEGFDATCYNQIFGGTHPETLFISIGSASDIKVAHKKRIPLIKAIAGGIQIIRIRDKDILEAEQIEDGFQKGIGTLTRREIESYLLADEVLIKLCHRKNKSDKVDELLAAKRRLKKDVLKSNSEADKPDDQLKLIAKHLYESAKDILDLQGEYTSKKPEKDFMKYDLAPLIEPGMKVYEELHADIFGGRTMPTVLPSAI